jgi:hypothetical protein
LRFGAGASTGGTPLSSLFFRCSSNACASGEER